MLDDAQARWVAACIAAHLFHAKHKPHVCELQNLVIEAADLGLLELHAAQLFAAIVTDADDDVGHPLAVVEAHSRDLLLRLIGRVDGFVHAREDAVARGGGMRRRGSGRDLRLQLDAKPRYYLFGNLRD